MRGIPAVAGVPRGLPPPAVTDAATQQPLPLADPAAPSDPLRTVNATLADAPNARAVEMQLELPLASYASPLAGAAAQLPVTIDLEQMRCGGSLHVCARIVLGTHAGWQAGLAACCWHAFTCVSVAPRPATPPRRMASADGLCSLRLRTPCEWGGALYEAVVAVAPIPVLSGE